MSKIADLPGVTDIEIVETKGRGRSKNWDVVMDGEVIHTFYEVDKSLVIPKVHLSQLEVKNLVQAINIKYLKER